MNFVYTYTVEPLYYGHFGTMILVLITEVSSIQRSLNTLQYYTRTQNGVLIIEVSAIQRFVKERFHCIPFLSLFAVYYSAHSLLELFVKDTQERPVLLCDEAVYSKNRNFRIYLSSKLGCPNRCLRVATENTFKVKLLFAYLMDILA